MVLAGRPHLGTIFWGVLVPATMRLLGEWHWWFPGWLDRILPTVELEKEAEPEREVAATRAA